MARIRTIKPDFAFDEELAGLPTDTRLFFIVLWTHMDREGRCEDLPGKLRALIFPYEPEKDVEAMLGHLNPKFVLRYEVEGKRYLWVRKWTDHQRPNLKEGASVIPPPPKNLTKTPIQHVPARESTYLAPTLHLPSTLDKGKGKGRGKEEQPSVVPKPLSTRESNITHGRLIPVGKTVLQERDLLDLRMPFGEFRGVHVSSLPAEQADWLLTKWSGRNKLGKTLKAALQLRVRLKNEEAKR